MSEVGTVTADFDSLILLGNKLLIGETIRQVSETVHGNMAHVLLVNFLFCPGLLSAGVQSTAQEDECDDVYPELVRLVQFRLGPIIVIEVH